jgi:hypothetical protein
MLAAKGLDMVEGPKAAMTVLPGLLCVQAAGRHLWRIASPDAVGARLWVD